MSDVLMTIAVDLLAAAVAALLARVLRSLRRAAGANLKSHPHALPTHQVVGNPDGHRHRPVDHPNPCHRR